MTTTLSNDAMKAGRFERWAKARKLRGRIVSHLEAGGQVMVVTYTKATTYKSQHADWFKAERNGVFVRRGKSWDCIDFCKIAFSRMEGAASN